MVNMKQQMTTASNDVHMAKWTGRIPHGGKCNKLETLSPNSLLKFIKQT